MSWIYLDDLVPKSICAAGRGGEELAIEAAGGGYRYGKGICACGPVEPGMVYSISVPCRVSGAPAVAQAVADLNDAAGKPAARLYLERREDGASFGATVEIPPEACALQLEGLLWSKDGGTAFFGAPTLICEGPYVPRYATLGTAWVDTLHDPTREDNLNNILRIADRAGSAEDKPDLLVFSEAIYGRNVKLPLAERAVRPDGPQVGAVRAMAARHRMYIVIGLHIDNGGFFTNEALLIDRRGELQGRYVKTHLTMTEREIGLVPGNDFPVFDVSFGRLGMLICWDQYFCEPARLLQLKDVDVIALPTAGDTPWQSRARAVDSGAYVVMSGMHGSESSMVLDPYGQVVARVDDPGAGYALARVDIGRRRYTYWLSVGPCMGEGRNVFRHERRPELYEGLRER